MTRICAVQMLLFLLFATAGCEKKVVSVPVLQKSNLAVYAASPQRYIAESHKIEVVASESQLEKSWNALVAYCGTIQCEVVSSSVTAKAKDSEPTGTVSMRVAPGDLSKLLAKIEELGRVAKHTTQREDKTDEVVDADARIKNLTAFRDNLRAMLAKPSATVKDLVDIQQQLTDAQSQLDSETAMRKILANETEKIAVEVTFNVEEKNGVTGGFAEIWNALEESGSDLADSTATLISVTATVIPWLIIAIPVVWLAGKGWRRLRRNRLNAQSSSPAS